MQNLQQFHSEMSQNHSSSSQADSISLAAQQTPGTQTRRFPFPTATSNEELFLNFNDSTNSSQNRGFAGTAFCTIANHAPGSAENSLMSDGVSSAGNGVSPSPLFFSSSTSNNGGSTFYTPFTAENSNSSSFHFMQAVQLFAPSPISSNSNGGTPATAAAGEGDDIPPPIFEQKLNQDPPAAAAAVIIAPPPPHSNNPGSGGMISRAGTSSTYTSSGRTFSGGGGAFSAEESYDDQDEGITSFDATSNATDLASHGTHSAHTTPPPVGF